MPDATLPTGLSPELEVRDVLGVEPRQVRVFRDPRQQIRLTLLGDRSYLRVRAMYAFPLTYPHGYIGLADGNNKQICLIRDLADLDATSQEIVRELLEVRYLAPRLTRIYSVKDEFGVVRFSVETDRGPRQLFVRHLRDALQDLPDDERLMVDVEGNRYIVPRLASLDRDSRLRFLSVI